jgi:predicted AAA+ superfamily ATPase
LGIDTVTELVKSPFAGALFEGFIASEIIKAQVNRGRRLEIYHFRDEQGLEVDFVVPGKGGSIALVECKNSRTVTPAMAAPMRRLADALRKKRPSQTGTKQFLVHQPPRAGVSTKAVAPGVRAVAWQDFVGDL